MIDPTTLLAGGAAVGFLVAIWSRLRALATRLLSLVVVDISAEDDAAKAVIYYCWKNFKRSPFGARRYGSFLDYVRPRRRYEAVAFEAPGKDPLVFWHGCRPVVLRYDVPPAGQATLSRTFAVRVTFLRGTFDIDAFVGDAVEEFNAFRHCGSAAGRFVVNRYSGRRNVSADPRAVKSGGPETSNAPDAYDPEESNSPDRRLIRWTPEEVGSPKEAGDPVGILSMSTEMTLLLEEGRRWLASEAWYKSKRLKWRRGWLLYGPPGTGKSTLVRVVGQVLDLPVIVFELATFDNDDFSRAWQKVLNRAPCVVLIEDIDGVFEGRTNVTGPTGLTFDCFLNHISGAADASGLLLVVTTNRVGVLDEALGKPLPGGRSTRPGRIDRTVEFGPLSEAGRRQMAGRILSDCPAGEIEAAVAAGAGDTGALFEERCSTIALSHYWRDHGEGQEGHRPQGPADAGAADGPA